MTKKIFQSIFIVAMAVFLACLMVIMGVLYEYFTAVQRNQLTDQMALASQGVENEGASYFEGLKTTGYRITWIAADGTVLYDSEADAAGMENHAQREEVKQAMEYGAGEGERTSATLAEKTIYRAQRLSNGTVLRVSVTQYTIMSIILGMLQPIVVVIVAAVALSAVLAHRLAKRIVEPLNSLDLDNPLENDAYEELSPLLSRVERQHKQIDKQVGELKRRQDEFSAVTENMSEGLILLNEDGVILSINQAAAKLFNTTRECMGQNILMVDRSLSMQKLIAGAQGGRRAEEVAELAGGEYQIDASPVISDKKTVGVCILTFDVTDKARAEQQRREFSANVSHELKTPLQSIMGSAELMENGLVKSEDMPRFIGHIRLESARLVTLIDDIIRLSQLDEGAELPQERVNLLPLAEEVANELSDKAAEKNVAMKVTGEEACVTGVRRLLHEMLYNLCDNAVKYNVKGGGVEINVSRDGGRVKLSVSDTGIGIPKEHQPRVFERFYRVDKSHSKETGGTGLGLSIVKHAAKYHGASIELESENGKGTRINVYFPKNDAAL